MARPITIKIDFDKIDQSLLFQGKKGRYLDLVLIEKASDYGDTHMVVQGVTKEMRESGTRGPILGNAKLDNQEEPPRRSAPPQRQPPRQTARPSTQEPEDIW